tara:strand:- start:1042 stop:2085 length:1044 start_codon:yes stop_codon:yes gene_type:complete
VAIGRISGEMLEQNLNLTGNLTFNGDALTIASDGKIGIKNNTPGVELDVTGTARANTLTVLGDLSMEWTITMDAQDNLNFAYNGNTLITYDNNGNFSGTVVTELELLTDVDFTTNTPTTTSGLFLTSDGDSSYSFTEKIRIGSNGNTVFTGNLAQYNANLVDSNGTARSISGPLGGSDIYSSHATLLAAENSKSVLELYTYYGMEYGKISFGNVGVVGSWNPVEQATISSFNNGGGDGGILEFKTKAISGSLTQRMVITESGEVRIGSGYLNTDKLQVGGNIAFTGGLNLMSGSNTVQWTIDRDASNNLIFSYQGADKMKLDTSGNLTEVSKLASTGKAIAMSIVFG